MTLGQLYGPYSGQASAGSDDGTITLVSEETSKIMVNGMNLIPISAGKCMVHLAISEGTYYASAISDSMLINVVNP